MRFLIAFALVLITVLILPSTSRAQVEMRLLEADRSGSVIRATIAVQNLGPPFQFMPGLGPYGEALAPEHRPFVLLYEDSYTGERGQVVASSVMIETVFGTTIGMDPREHRLPSTGVDAAQVWQVIFPYVPEHAGDMRLRVLGSVFRVGDMPGAQAARETRAAEEREIAARARMLVDSSRAALDRSEWRASLAHLERAIRLDPKQQARTEQLYQNVLIGLCLEGLRSREYQRVLERCEEAHAATGAEELSDPMRAAFTSLGAEASEKHAYSGVIEYADRAQALSLRSDSLQALAGRAWLRVAERHEKEQRFEAAADAYRSAVEEDPATLRPVVLEVFRNKQESPAGRAVLAVIPGASAFARQQATEGIIDLVATGTLLGGAAVSYFLAEQTYDQYLTATTVRDARDLYSEANGLRRMSFALAGATGVWRGYSIYRAYRATEERNRLFSPDQIRISILPSWRPDLQAGVVFAVTF